MPIVLRTAAIYVFILLLLRLAGKRTVGEMSVFDFVIVLMLSESVQGAMLGDDYSLTGAMLAATTLVGVDVLLGKLNYRLPRFSAWVEDRPSLLISNGALLEDAMRRLRIDVDDILEAARRTRGIASLGEIRFAVLERTGGISIIPFPPGDMHDEPDRMNP